MRNYRGKLDIIADILGVASKNANKTQIMYQANLSYTGLQRYLSEVSGAQLISFVDSKRRYELTNKGREFLADYVKYSKTNKRARRKLDALATRRRSLEKLYLEAEL